MDWMILPLKRYADFSGRSCRQEFWMFVLFEVLVLIGGAILFGMMAGMSRGAASSSSGLETVGIWLLVLGILALFIPNLAVRVRRFHDQDKSGWMVLLGFIPYIGGFIMLAFMCMEGTRGPNQYGPDPRDPEGRQLDTLSSVFE
jgi:uncharacterized membrane protein YhaH (DUF805 family)